MAHFDAPPASRKKPVTPVRSRLQAPSHRRRHSARPPVLTYVLNWGIPLLFTLGAILLVGVCCAGFGSGHSTTNGTTNQAANARNTISTLSLGQEAPDFTLPTLGGGTFQLVAQRGHPVVLYFIATTCTTCAQGSQQLAQVMQTANVRGAQALAIDVNPGDRPADLQAFVQSVGQPASTTLQWGIDPNGTIATAYGLQTLETMVVTNTHGQIVARSNNPIPPARLTQLVRSAAGA
jgi:peroxiredoxin